MSLKFIHHYYLLNKNSIDVDLLKDLHLITHRTLLLPLNKIKLVLDD